MNLSKREINIVGGGLFATAIGAMLRWHARDLAWPSSYSYSGARENTQWAIREVAISEIGMVLYIFGLAVLLLVVAKLLFVQERE